MKISHKLWGNIGLFVALGLIFMLVLIWTRDLSRTSTALANHLNEIELGSYQLSLLTYDIILHPQDLRGRRQWRMKYENFIQLLEDRLLRSYSSQQELERLRSIQEGLGRQYHRLISAVSDEESLSSEPGLAQQRQSRIASMILSLAQDMASAASTLRESFAEEHLKAQERLFTIAFVVTLMATLLLILLSLVVARALVQAFRRLKEGTIQVTEGDLSHRIQLQSGDELEEYAEAFNHMVARLSETMASRDDLNREVQGHLQAEAALREYRDVLEVKVKERTEALERSRMAAISIMEDANRLRRQAEQARDETEKVNQALEHEIRVREQIERKLLDKEASLKQAIIAADNANQAKSTFLANMSHELRTPLNAVLGFSELMARDPLLDSENKDRLTIINRSGTHLLDMINDVLDLSKIEAGHMELEPETCDLNQLLNDLNQMISVRAAEKDLRFRLEIDPNIERFIRVDKGKLRQILINLLGNSLKFTSSGGICLRARTIPHTPGTAGDDVEGARVLLQLEVEDSGMGIAEEKLGHIFIPFVQAGSSPSAGKGTGLGLAITKSLAQLMGGQVEVESTLGKGSVFSLQIPAVTAQQEVVIVHEHDTPAVVAIAPGQPEWRILIVDDNLENRMLLRLILERVGFQLQEAENGQQAIDRYLQWQPDFIWMDMRMPEMDGYEATRRIRKLSGGDVTKIVAITASAFKEQKGTIIAAGCDEVVRKPYRTHEVYDVMHRVLGVEFVYDTGHPSKESQVDTPRNGVATFDTIAHELAAPLLDAAKRLDGEALLSLLQEADMDADAKQQLTGLVAGFRFDTIMELLAPHGRVHK